MRTLVSPRARAATPALRPLPTAGRLALFLAFALSVMADPVSSVAYAIEAALRALDGNLALLLPAMGAVVLVIALVVASYHGMVARFPEGGGSAAAAGSAFGESFTFVPMGALIVDFVLTIAISVAAGSSAIISYVPSLAPYRLVMALGLLVVVAALMLIGHLGRIVFAALTVGFIGIASAVVLSGLGSETAAAPTGATHGAPLAVALAFPVAMALATGIEAPSSAIAELDDLDNDGRRRFGQAALWMTLGVVGTLTLGLTAAIVYFGIHVPHEDTTLVAELARATSSPQLFALFQGATALLLLSAASSSFQAGPGLLKALARKEGTHGSAAGVLPGWLGRTNTHHAPYWGIAVFLVASALVVAAADARETALVLFYAVSVFVGFVMGLTAMARFARRERRWWMYGVNIAATVAVAFTLIMNVVRLEAVIALAATLVIGGLLHWEWIRAGRPRGVSSAEARAHDED